MSTALGRGAHGGLPGGGGINCNQLLGDRKPLGLQGLAKEEFFRKRERHEPKWKAGSLGTGNQSVGLEQKAERGRMNPRQGICITPESSFVSILSQCHPKATPDVISITAEAFA